MRLIPGLASVTVVRALCIVIAMTGTGVLAVAHAQWQPKNYLMKTDPKHAKGLFWEDPNVWVYTRSFAERFAMPEQWVSDELTGAQALAYRIMYDKTQTCGWFGDPTACRYNYSCILDIYTDHDAGLPWKPNAPEMGVNPFMADKSPPFLSPQKRSDSADWDPVRDHYDRQRDILGISGMGILAGKPYGDHSYSMRESGRLFVYEYKRNVYPGLDYLSISFGCINHEQPENFRLRLGREDQSVELTAEPTEAYEIRVPYSFLVRVGEYVDRRHKGNSIWDDVKKRMSKAK